MIIFPQVNVIGKLKVPPLLAEWLGVKANWLHAVHGFSSLNGVFFFFSEVTAQVAHTKSQM